MPSGPRIRTDNVFGTLTDNPLTSGATTMNSAGLANLAAVSSAHALIVIDPLRSAGAPECVIVTAHTGSATSATITRGAYGTSARQHASGVLWVHAPNVEDFIRITTSGARPSDPYRGQLTFETDTNCYVGRDTSDAWQTVVNLGAWTSYTPTLTQVGAVTKTNTRSTWVRHGRTIQGQFSLAVTGAGTAGTFVSIGLPVSIAQSPQIVIGACQIYDASANVRYVCTLEAVTATTCAAINDASQGNAWGGLPNLALAAGDLIGGHFQYEALS